MEWLHYFATSPVIQSILGGVVTAAFVDWQAFRAWKTWHDIATYDWSTATFRWFQGAAAGFVTSGIWKALDAWAS